MSSRHLPQGRKRGAFPLTGRVQAGALAQAPLKPGEAMRIFTGAPMPEGADTVFMQEDVRVEGGNVVLPAGPAKPGANVRPAGEDVPLGHAALRATGQRLRPQDIALAAAFGLSQLGDVIRRIRVAVFSTGNELVSPSERRAAPQLFDSNRFMLMAMLRRLGCEVSDLGILRDERAALASALQAAAGSHDLIHLTTGGVSTGEEDHVGGRGRKRRSAGIVADGDQAWTPRRDGHRQWHAPFIGLPGNPVASFVTFVHVVRPTILALSGGILEPLVPMPVRAGFAYREEDRPPRICPRQPAQGRGRRARGDQVSACEGRGCCRRWSTPMGWWSWLKKVTLVERTDGWLPVLCKPDLKRVR